MLVDTAGSDRALPYPWRMNDAEFRSAIERGIAAHWAGQFAKALLCYREALAARPDDAEALSLAGLAMTRTEEAGQSLGLLRRAVELEPSQAGFRVNLAEGLLKTGNSEEARQVLDRVVTDFPENVNAWEKLGDIAASRSDWDAAATAWSRAIACNTRGALPAIKLARLEISRSRYEAALSPLETAATRAPDDPTVLVLRGFALTELRNWPALVAIASDWVRRFPESIEGWRLAARAAFELGRHRQACDWFANILKLATATAADLAAFAGLSLHALDFDSAAAALDRAEAMDPNNAEMLSSRAQLLMYRGDFAAATVYSERALVRNPDHAPALTILSRLRRGRLSDDEQVNAARIADDRSIHIDHRIAAGFAVAHTLDAKDNVDAAFKIYGGVHAMAIWRDQRENRKYDRAQVEKRGRWLAELPAVPTLADAAIGGPRPIFIFGMPRSGTTLIEAVLAAHPRVFGCGERPSMQQVLRAFIGLDTVGRAPDTAQLQDWAAAYLSELPNLGGKDHVTDKHPLNFETAGLIIRLFPNAALIYVRRNPLETGLSIYRQEFNKHWVFAHQLADIGHYYGHCARLAAHWDRVLPGRITTIQYEDFVGDFANMAQALLEACGLDWDPRCLEFQKTQRAIATFSTVQAREPVRNANGRAAHYEKHLPALVSALQEAGVDLQTGALRP